MNVGGGLVSKKFIFFNSRCRGGVLSPLLSLSCQEIIFFLSYYYRIIIIFLSYYCHIYVIFLLFSCLFLAWNSHFFVWNRFSFTYSPLIKHLKQRIQALRQSLLFLLHFICIFLSLLCHIICILIALFYHYFVKKNSPDRLNHSLIGRIGLSELESCLFLGL